MNSEGLILITAKPPHPGEFLREDYLPECNLTVAQFAERIGVSRQTANELVHERRAVSSDMALRLGKLFGTSAQYWLNLQRNVDLWNSLELSGNAIANIIPLEIPDADISGMESSAQAAAVAL